MSDAVSIVAIAAGACGTLGGVLFGGWREDRRLGREAILAETKDLDVLVAAAAEAVTQALGAFERRKTSSDENVRERGEAFDDTIQRVALVETSIAIRFGPEHPATQAYRVALVALRDLGREVFEAEKTALERGLGSANYDKVKSANDDFLHRAQPTPLSA
jgi:hypothetical protein